MILVTGGTGFLGAYIIKELIEKGHRVRAIRRSNTVPTFIPPSIMDKVEWMNGDILDVVSLEEAMSPGSSGESVEAVIHSAAVVSFLARDRKRMMQINVEGTANVVNMALEKQVKKLVHISSVAALGRLASGGHVNEEKKWEETSINTDYAKSKHRAELEIWRGISEGLDAVILNPSTILGYGDWNTGSCSIFKTIYNEFKWYAPGLNGFVDVTDVAKLTVSLMEGNISGERYIINGENWHFKQLQDSIADHFGKKRPRKKSGAFLLGLAWRLEKLRSLFTDHRPLVTKQSVKVALSQTWFENDKILAAMPQFSFTPLEKSIQKACEKYLDDVKRLQP